jgi:hypothetical protein
MRGRASLLRGSKRGEVSEMSETPREITTDELLRVADEAGERLRERCPDAVPPWLYPGEGAGEAESKALGTQGEDLHV